MYEYSFTYHGQTHLFRGRMIVSHSHGAYLKPEWIYDTTDNTWKEFISNGICYPHFVEWTELDKNE